MWGLFKKKPPPDSSAAPVPAAPLAVDAPAAATLPTPEPATATTATPVEKKGWLDKLKSGLTATRDKLGLKVLFAGKLDETTLEQLEAQLLMADCGMAATQHLRRSAQNAGSWLAARAIHAPCWWMPGGSAAAAGAALRGGQRITLRRHDRGVSAAGKTTSIGKLAKYLQQQGASVLLAAGDTFRAAARASSLPSGANATT